MEKNSRQFAANVMRNARFLLILLGVVRLSVTIVSKEEGRSEGLVDETTRDEEISMSFVLIVAKLQLFRLSQCRESLFCAEIALKGNRDIFY
jgi:hypothetical protein